MSKVVAVLSLFCCGWLIPGHAEASDPGPWSVTLRGGLLAVNPEARVREYDLEGTYLGLNHQPGLNTWGGQAEITIARRLGRFSVELGGSYNRQTGSGNSGSGFAFNGGVFPPGRAMTSTLETTRLVLQGTWQPAREGALSHLRVLAGLELYHPILTLLADPAIPIHDSHEDYLQFFPLPMLGVRGILGPASGTRVEAEVRGGTAKNWDTLRSEGGPMRMDLTLVEAALLLHRPLSHRLDLVAGATARFADGTLTSAEDGNWIRSREEGLELGLAWHF